MEYPNMPSMLERLLGMNPPVLPTEDALAEAMQEAQEEAQHDEDDTPHYYRLVNVLERIERRLEPTVARFSDIIEEYGVYNTTDHTCKVTQSIMNPIKVKTILGSFDTAITSWTLTMGRKIVTFNSSGSNGLLFLPDCDFSLYPGDTRSLNPVTGTPAVNTNLYIIGEMVRVTNA